MGHERTARCRAAVGARSMECTAIVEDSASGRDFDPTPLRDRCPPASPPRAFRAGSPKARGIGRRAEPAPSGANPPRTRRCRRLRWFRRARSSTSTSPAAPPSAGSCRPGERRAAEPPGGFPQHVVLIDPRARPAAQARAPQTHPRVKDRSRNRAVRLPCVADLARKVAGVPSLPPVPLVGVETRLELAAEERFETIRQACRGLRIDEPLDDQESVLVKSCDLGGTRFVDQEHRSRFRVAGNSVQRACASHRRGMRGTPFWRERTQAPTTRRSLVPSRRKPFPETWLNCDDRLRSRRPGPRRRCLRGRPGPGRKRREAVVRARESDRTPSRQS